MGRSESKQQLVEAEGLPLFIDKESLCIPSCWGFLSFIATVLPHFFRKNIDRYIVGEEACFLVYHTG